jgi:hypothetical protein
MIRRLSCLPQGIEYRRASNSNRRLLMSRQMSDWWLVEASPDIDVYSVGNFICHFGGICGKGLGGFIVARRCE